MGFTLHVADLLYEFCPKKGLFLPLKWRFSCEIGESSIASQRVDRYDRIIKLDKRT